MAVHLIHVSKTGGSALRYALRAARKKAGGRLDTEWGPVWGHDHRFRMVHLEPGDKAVFALRDPAARFVSSFYSRLRQGKPRYDIPWTPRERRSFEWFETPRALADALAEPGGEARKRAVYALRSIKHVNQPMTLWVGSPAALYRNLGKVLYVARQESLAEDWERIKELLGLPREQELPEDETIAHRTDYTGDRTISEEGVLALRRWYAEDYALLEIAEALRHGQAPPAPPIQKRLVALVASAKPRQKFDPHPPDRFAKGKRRRWRSRAPRALAERVRGERVV